MANGGPATLRVQGGPNSGATVPLSRSVTMGRRKDNDIVDSESTVSRRHALIMETPEGFVLLDLNTTNGTFINLDRIGLGPQKLKEDDRIRLAGSDVSFVFSSGLDGGASDRDRQRTGVIERVPAPAREPEMSIQSPPKLAGRTADLHRLLESRKGDVISREEIMRHVFGGLVNSSEANRTIDEAIDSVRVAIGDDPVDPQNLITVGEFGFLLV